MIKFLKRIFGAKKENNSGSTEGIRVVELGGAVDKVYSEDKGDEFSEYYLKGILRSYIKRGLIKEYPYIKKWISEVENKEFPDEIEFDVNNISSETDLIRTLKNVWRTRYYTTEDENLQKFMTKK